PASILETEILPARLDGYDPGDLDVVMAAGEVVWIGVETLGEHDGRIAFYLAEHVAKLLPPVVGDGLPPSFALNSRASFGETRRSLGACGKAVARGTRLRAPPTAATAAKDLSDRERAIVDILRARGASFFGPVHEAAGGGYPAETVSALWTLAWRGLVTNDTFQ